MPDAEIRRVRREITSAIVQFLRETADQYEKGERPPVTPAEAFRGIALELDAILEARDDAGVI